MSQHAIAAFGTPCPVSHRALCELAVTPSTRYRSDSKTRFCPHLSIPSIRHPTMVQWSHKSLGEGAYHSEDRASMYDDHSDAFGMHAEHEE